MDMVGQKVRQARLRWYGYVKRRDDNYVGRKVLDMRLGGKRKRGRPKRMYFDVVKEDTQEVGAREDEALNKVCGKSAVATLDEKS